MSNAGALLIYVLMAALGALALSRRDESFRLGLLRGVEQLVKLLPRMLCALVGASFIVKLIPTDVIGLFIGEEAGLLGVLVGAIAGPLIPAGPVVAFAIAAVLANEGASFPALIAFITSWSVFCAHRIVIFEIPLLGASFLRLRLASVAVLPLVAGTLTFVADRLIEVLAA